MRHLIAFLIFGSLLSAQEGLGEIRQQGTFEVQAITEGLMESGDSVIDTLSRGGDTLSSNLQPVTGNDFVEPVLGKGVQILGGGVLGELPLADGSAALGSLAGGDTKAAADTAVAGGMGAIAGWGTAGVVTTILEGATVTIGGVTAPSWLPPLMAGAAAGWATKSIYGWLLKEPEKEPESDTAVSVEAPLPVRPPTNAPSAPAPASAPPPASPAPSPSAAPAPRTPRDRSDHDHSGGHHG